MTGDPGQFPGDVGQGGVEPQADPEPLVVGQRGQAGLEEPPGIGREEEQAEDRTELDLGPQVGVDLALVEPADANVQVRAHFHPFRLLALARGRGEDPHHERRQPAVAHLHLVGQEDEVAIAGQRHRRTPEVLMNRTMSGSQPRAANGARKPTTTTTRNPVSNHGSSRTTGIAMSRRR